MVNEIVFLALPSSTSTAHVNALHGVATHRRSLKRLLQRANRAA